MSKKFLEMQMCGECDSDEPVRQVRAGEDEIFTVCEACRSVEGATRTVYLNRETEELLTEEQYCALPDEEA